MNQEFKMVESRTSEGLEQGVNLLLSHGWRLHGVTMMAHRPGRPGTAGMSRFVQALVHDHEETGA